jgi:hypothetical protein
LWATVLLFIGSTMVFTILTPFLHDELQMHASLIFTMSFVRMFAAALGFEPVARREQHVGARRIQGGIWRSRPHLSRFLGSLDVPQYVLQVGVLVSLNILAGIT